MAEGTGQATVSANTSRGLTSLLFADIASSTTIAAEMGDAAWSSLLRDFRGVLGEELGSLQGRLIKWTGDGFLATFDRPGAAVETGLNLIEESHGLGLELRCGIHTGEVVWEETDVAGLAVHAAARIMAAARPSELLVSQTTVDLTIGADWQFDLRGPHRLKGVPGDWMLYSVRRHRDAEQLLSPTAHQEPVHLVEREPELRTMLACLEEAGRGSASVIVLSGEAGIGKTSVIRAFAAAASDQARFLIGGSDDLITPRTLGPIRDVLAAAGFTSRPNSLDQVIDLLDDVLAHPAITVLILEDLHWADDATIDATRHLCRRVMTPDTRALVVLTLRDEETGEGHPLRRLLGSLTGDRVRRINLRALSAEGVASMPGAATVDVPRLYHLTGGNPLFVTELLATSSKDVPASIKDAVIGRLGRLSESSRRLIRYLSVAPGRSERALAHEVISDPVPALAEGEQGGVIQSDSTHIWFRHELVRQAVEAALSASERLEWNRQIGRRLAAIGGESSRIMHHASVAGDVDTILAHGPAAATEAMRAGAYRQGTEHLRRVLIHQDHLDPTTNASLTRELSHGLYLVNHFAASLEAGRRSVALWETLENEQELAAALLTFSRSAYWATGPLAAVEAGERALALLARQPNQELLALTHATLARAHSNLVTLGIVAQPSQDALRYAQAALELAEELDRDDLRSHALNYRGTARLALGEVGGLEDLERSTELVRSNSRVEYVMRACVNAAGGAYRSGRFELAEAFIEQGLAAGETGGEFYAGEYRLDLTRAAINASRGDWDLAEGQLRQLLERPGEPGIMRPLAESLLGRLLARRSRPDAEMHVEAAVAASAGSIEPALLGPVAAARLELAWLRREHQVPEFCRTALDRASAIQYCVAEGELARYLQRMGALGSYQTPTVLPRPWSTAVNNRPTEAAKEWLALGEVYEAAIETALANDNQGFERLESLGAAATIDALSRS